MHRSGRDEEARRLIAIAVKLGDENMILFTAEAREIVDSYLVRVEENRKHLHALGLTGPILYSAYTALYCEWEAEGLPKEGETREAVLSIGDAIYLVTGDEAYAGQRLEGEA